MMNRCDTSRRPRRNARSVFSSSSFFRGSQSSVARASRRVARDGVATALEDAREDDDDDDDDGRGRGAREGGAEAIA